MAPQEQQPPDQIYQYYGKDLYRLTGSEMSDSIFEALGSNPSADNSQAVAVSAGDIMSGVTTATQQTASGSQQAGKKLFDNTVAGYILGVDPKDGFAKLYVGNTTKYINWDGNNLTVVGGVSVSQLDIPDTITANSFHVDTTGNAWWGATTLGASTASVLNTGVATFSNITINGSTISFQNDFGDGSDGVGTISGDTILTRDMFYTNLTVNSGKNLTTASFRIFVNGILTINSTGVIRNNGNAASGSTGATAVSSGSLPGTVAGQNGGAGASQSGGAQNGTNGTAGFTVAKSLCVVGGVSAAGGYAQAFAGGSATGGAGQSAGTQTGTIYNLIHSYTPAYNLFDVLPSGLAVFTLASGSASGGGGAAVAYSTGGSVQANGGAGGGSGSPGGIVWISAKSIVNNGTISAKGGAGADGAIGTATSSGGHAGAGGGGGGAGGSGGVVILICSSKSGSGTVDTTAGTAGVGGTGAAAGGNVNDIGNGGGTASAANVGVEIDIKI
jgi:hypothetical protein